MTKTIKIMLPLFAIIMILLTFANYFVYPDRCANTVISSEVSPDNSYKVVLFERNCGATTGFSSHLSLLKLNEELENESGNIYIADRLSDTYRINWETSASVRITGSSGNHHKQVKKLNGINFIFD